MAPGVKAVQETASCTHAFSSLLLKSGKTQGSWVLWDQGCSSGRPVGISSTITLFPLILPLDSILNVPFFLKKIGFCSVVKKQQ